MHCAKIMLIFKMIMYSFHLYDFSINQHQVYIFDFYSFQITVL